MSARDGPPGALDDLLRSMDFEFFGSGVHKTTAADLLSSDDALFLDVRSTEERDTVSFGLLHHLPVLHVPMDELPDRLGEVPRDMRVGVFCPSCVRATMAYLYLRLNGYRDVCILEGGYAGILDELRAGKVLERTR